MAVSKHTPAEDAAVAVLYRDLSGIEVFKEKGPARVKAVRKAAEILTAGYSLRGAAKAAGLKPDTKLDRYFTVARAMLAQEEGEGKACPIPVGPEGQTFGSWLDAVGGMFLEDLVAHVRANRPGAKLPDVDKAMRAAVNSLLAGLTRLSEGKGKGKAVAGFKVGSASLVAYVKAYADAGLSVKGLDSMTLPVEPVAGKGAATIIAALQAAGDALAAGTVETGTLPATGTDG
jgi:lambda repressor-like predicted transcriptional regulator